jgi:protein-S-isoprenylcysteine O-methyltransferase Ste14
MGAGLLGGRCFVGVDPPMIASPLVFLSFYLLLVVILNILESWAWLADTINTATAQKPKQHHLLTTTRKTLHASTEQ